MSRANCSLTKHFFFVYDVLRVKSLKTVFLFFLVAAAIGLVSWYSYDLVFKKEPTPEPVTTNLPQTKLLPTQVPTNVPPEMREKLIEGAVFQKVEVSITSQGFEPETLTVHVGDRVKWINNDSQDHRLMDNQERWESETIKPSDTFTQIFDASGTYEYSDDLHPGFSGKIIVEK